jgi:dihydropteroate synthase type 2
LPTLLGILNLSPDSFSDGGQVEGLEAARIRARELIDGGADVVDVGAVSSHPDAIGLTAEAEIERLGPVIEALDDDEIPVSVDSFSPEVQRWAAPQVAVLNDIRGFPDPSVWPVLADASCSLIVMHAVQGGPADRRSTDPAGLVDRILRFFDGRLAELQGAGIDLDRVVVDPGMGFFLGDQPEPSLVVLRALDRIRAHTGRPVLVGVSRKSFLGALIGGRPPAGRGAASLAAEIWAAAHGADWIRTHDPAALHDALSVWSAVEG